MECRSDHQYTRLKHLFFRHSFGMQCADGTAEHDGIEYGILAKKDHERMRRDEMIPRRKRMSNTKELFGANGRSQRK